MQIQVAKEHNINKEQVRQTGNTLADTFKEIAKAYPPVDRLDNAAGWNEITNELYVLQNPVKFEIRTNISSNGEIIKSVAIKYHF